MQSYIDRADKCILGTYKRFPVVWERGEGMYLYDVDGKAYLDFCAGIAVFSLGYNNGAVNEALKAQIDKITHCSNLYYNVPAIEAGERLLRLSGMERIFFTNSGAEAVEGAIKCALKYAYLRTDKSGHEIIAMEKSFHGRTLGALSVTGTKAYREPFEPLPGHVKFATFNDFDSVRACVSENTCAIILEPVQGEGGIYPADADFLKNIRRLCDDRGIILILDEIQCGMGRCGTMFAYEQYGLRPDILTLAKALGGGVPVGAFLLNKDVAAHSLTLGDHGTTYGGNPLAAAAINAVLDQYGQLGIIDQVGQSGAYLEQCLNRLVESHDFVLCRRGMGLMQAIECAGPVAPILDLALAKGLVLIAAGANVIRFIPPLIVTEADIDKMMGILEQCL